ncbi:PKD domain-containing protein [Nocardioides zeicaulis]|uniref:PKD domain-containing protein n=1 Tax=Nocardioides zeicaulis TaxID=1776857 RepID=UPI0039EEF689
MLVTAPPGQAGVTETPYPSLPMPWRLAVGGPEAHLYTAFLSGGTTQVTESDTNGAHLRDVQVGSVPLLSGFDVDPSGNLYLAFRDSSSNADVLRKVGPTGTGLWETTLTTSPRDLSVGGGTVWVVSAQGTGVQGYADSTGETLGGFAASGSSVEALPGGHVLVSSSSTGITEYDQGGAVLRRIPGATGPVDSTAAGDVVSTIQTSSGLSVRKWAADGSSTLGVDRGSAGAGDLAVAPNGAAWLLTNNIRVHLDPTTPDARLTSSAAQTSTGSPVALDASASSVPFASPTRFEWDLDGDGSFETDTGTSSRVSRTYDVPGARTIAVRVTAPAGGTATASTVVDVSTPSPAGPVGVSINQGARYTNDPHVTVFMRWPTHAKDVLVSNDGGFFPASQRPVAETVAWTLDSSGPERLPKTIYARFTGGQAGPETYQDDIILDQTVPSVLSASAAPSQGSRRSVDLAPRRAQMRWVVVLKAADKTSGVASMQVTTRKGKPGRWRAYRKRSTFTGTGGRILVRVSDGAGNVSRWKRLTVR